MSRNRSRSVVCAALAIVFLTPASRIQAVTKIWTGNSGIPGWNGFLNWNPLGPPGEFDEVVLNFGATELDQDYEILSIDLNAGGAEVDTNGNRLTVNGQILVDTSERIIVREHTSGPATASLEVEDIQYLGSPTLGQSEVVLEGGRIVAAKPGADRALIGGRGIIRGYGVLRFQDALSNVSTQLSISGGLQTTRPVGAAPAARSTLTIESSDPSRSTTDLAGIVVGGNSEVVVDIASMTTLDIDTLIDDSFHGVLNLGAGAIFDTSDSLDSTNALFVTDIGNAGVVNVDADSAVVGVPDNAIFRGPRLELGAETRLNIDSGTLILEDGLATQGSSAIEIAKNSSLQVFGTSTIDGDINFNSTGTQLLVNGNLTINDPSFDWDGPEDAVTTISNARVLTINANDIESGAEVFNGTININGGELRPNIAGGWTMAGDLNLNFGDVTASELMTVDGGTITTANGIGDINTPITLTGSAKIVLPTTSDRLQIQNDATIESSTMFSGDGVFWIDSTGDATLADGTNVAVPFANEGDLYIVDGVGTAQSLTYDQFVSGELFIEIGGTSSFDQLVVQNTANINGLLDVSLINGFTPSAGDAFTILASPVRVGQFINGAETLPNLPGGLEWLIDYSLDDIVLRVVESFSADFDNDGDVDGDDLTHPTLGWNARYGNDLDGGNFLEWQQQFGSGIGTLAASQIVPEPTSELLFSGFACLLLIVKVR